MAARKTQAKRAKAKRKKAPVRKPRPPVGPANELVSKGGKVKPKPRQPRSPRATRSRKKIPRGRKDPGGPDAIDWTEDVVESIRDLAVIGNTVEDMAKILKVSKSALETAIANEPEVREAYHGGGAELNSDLRRSQVKFAKRGNATLLKWLGIQRLGQRDVRAVELSGTDGGTLKVEGDLGPLVNRKINELIRSRGKT